MICKHVPLIRKALLGATVKAKSLDTPLSHNGEPYFVKVGDMYLFACSKCGSPYWGNGKGEPFSGV